MAVQTALVVGAIVAIGSKRLPLGIPGEWEWLRVKIAPTFASLSIGAAAVAAYSGFVALGYRSLSRPGQSARGREWAWVLGLAVASVAIQAAVQEAAPVGHGLSKWAFALRDPGANGYYTVAKTSINDCSKFLADYPTWIRKQGSLHIGTHPPGLFVVSYAAVRWMEGNPALASWVGRHSPESVEQAFRALAETFPLSRPDRSALTLIGALTLLCCALTVVPLYALARTRFDPANAWVSATLWPLVPAAVMFQPAADTAFPLVVVSALLLSAWSSRVWGWSIGAGLVLALGMQFTLAFLPVGLIVALSIAFDRPNSVRLRLIRFLATGFGFVGGTLICWILMRANPFSIWWANQVNHAGFYLAYPKSYRRWVLETPVEVAIALGLPTAFWFLAGLRKAPRETWATALILAILLFSGRSLSEVARLWIPYFPMLLLAAGTGFQRFQAKGIDLFVTVCLLGAQTLALQGMIQVVYPT